MAHTRKSVQDEELLGLRMVKDRLLSEAELSTARDFQKAVGGPLTDVLVRLGLVEPAELEAYLAKTGFTGIESTVLSPHEAPAEKRKDSKLERTAPLPIPNIAAARGQGEEGHGRSRKATGFAETSIVLDALIRLLVRKGVIKKAEIKEEVLKMDTEDLVKSGVLQRGD